MGRCWLRREADLPQVGSGTHRGGVPEWEHLSLFWCFHDAAKPREEIVNGLIYLIGLIVVILFILSFLGLR
jgi:hypothetical protein